MKWVISSLSVKVNSLTSIDIEIPYSYYSLPLCKPLDGIKDSAENLGELLMGDRIENSPYEFKMYTNETKLFVCRSDPLNANDLPERIDEMNQVNLLLDNLPAISPFAVVQELLREVEISHWGSVQVTEHYKLVHAGARHKGIFSRVEYQSRPSIRGISSFKHLLVQLPPRVHSVYYRDGIGNISTSRLHVGAKKGCIQEQYLVEEAMMYCMEYIHDGNLGSHKNGRRVIMNEDIERAHPMDKKGKQYVLPNIEYQQIRKWVLTHSLENAEWEEKYQVYLQSQKSRGKNRRGSQANELDYIPWLRLQLQNENVSPFKRIVDGKRSHVEASRKQVDLKQMNQASKRRDDKNKSGMYNLVYGNAVLGVGPYHIAGKLLILKKCQPTGRASLQKQLC
ncbi:hypothetical protein IFM89_012763 [Coptis chinensis]|uniref:Dolichyl-diphosphooligosaccharide--protein glycosyltransferase subunit 1 n=1 Tax=Coptis chinensis TaxID=261450 RepID=A0A835HCM7_9MAGN|nr:hypothetical protein IFM89_012763 [Coptis chinensis]